MTHRLRLRDLLSLPLFILLHVLFTVSSLALRLYESLSQPSPRARPPRNQARRPPRHVALVLSHPPPLPPRGWSLDIKRFTEERKALIESVRRAVQWAGEEGVVEMSVYDGQGMLSESTPLSTC